MICVNEIWLATDPLDMRAGFDTALARVVKVFGAAHPHHAYRSPIAAPALRADPDLEALAEGYALLAWKNFGAASSIIIAPALSGRGRQNGMNTVEPI